MSDKYAVGDIWKYRTRAGEEASTILINKIEIDPEYGVIYHISIRGVHVKSHRAKPNGAMTELSHSPVSLRTLSDSLTLRVSRSQPDSQYIAGYQHWKAAFQEGNAGIFNISIAEIVNVIERASY